MMCSLVCVLQMAVTNLVKVQPNDPAKRIADFSIEAILAANDTLIDDEDESKGLMNICCGFHSGSVCSGRCYVEQKSTILSIWRCGKLSSSDCRMTFLPQWTAMKAL
jgi:hypothetical protein